MLLELEQFCGKLDLSFEEVLGIEIVLGGVAGVLLNVQANGRSRGARSGQTHDNAAAGVETSVEALVGGDGAVEIGVGEVSSLGDSAVCELC